MDPTPSGETPQAEEPRPQWWRITPGFARSRGLFFIGLPASALLAGWLGSEHVWWLELPLHFQIQWLVLLLVGLLILGWACFGARRVGIVEGLAIVVGLALAGHIVAELYRWTPAQQALTPDADDDKPALGKLRILSFNVYSGNRRHEDLLELIEREDPDIVFLMELNSRWERGLASLSERYPFRRLHSDDTGNFGIGVWTRLPVESCTFPEFDSAARQLILEARVDDTSFRFIGIHPLPPRTAWYTEQRNLVYDGLAELLRTAAPLPTIVAGDFNNTRFTPRFKQFCAAGNLRDACYRLPPGRTWPAGTLHWFMGIHIDHVLIGPRWRVRDCRIEDNIGSDHYSVLVDLELT